MDDPSPTPGAVRTCPACHSPVTAGHKFCQVCGTKIPELPICRKCGAQFLAPVKFCEMCGTPVSLAEPEPTGEEVPEIRAPEPEPEYAESEPEPDLEPEVREPEPAIPDPMPDEPEPEPVTPEPKPKKPAPAHAPAKEKIASSPDLLAPEFSGLSDLGNRPASESVAPAPKKSSKKIALIAGGILVLLIIAAAVYFVGLPMLKGTGAPPVTTPPPAPVITQQPNAPTPLAAMPPVTPTPEPTPTEDPHQPLATQAMLKSQEVYFDVQKDGVTNEITVLYQRGPGENILNYAEVKVTYPDGTIKTGKITPSQGQTELLIKGSRETDRVEVIAYMHTGQAYHVKDLLVT